MCLSCMLYLCTRATCVLYPLHFCLSVDIFYHHHQHFILQLLFVALHVVFSFLFFIGTFFSTKHKHSTAVIRCKENGKRFFWRSLVFSFSHEWRVETTEERQYYQSVLFLTTLSNENWESFQQPNFYFLAVGFVRFNVWLLHEHGQKLGTYKNLEENIIGKWDKRCDATLIYHVCT